jgi:trimeric autotransporter adhesin
MEKFLSGFFTAIALTLIFNGAYAQTPAPGTVTFKYMNGTQTNSTSAYADFVPTSALGQDGGYGYEFITQGTGTNFLYYTQVSYYVFNGATNDGMISFDRNSTNVTVQAAFIRSARTGAVTTQGETSKPIAGGEFKMQSIDLLAISGTPTVSVQAYANGVAVGTPVTAVINSTTKTTINLSANPNFYDVDEIGITGFSAAGVRADNLVSTTAIVNTGAPAFSYASPQVYTSGTAITNLVPTTTGGAVGAFGPFTTFANVNTPTGVETDATGNVYATDAADNLVYIFNSGGTNLPGSPHVGGPSQTPYGIGIDASNNIYMANGPSGTVTRITAAGTVSNIGGFTFPVDVCTDGSNNVYVTDLGDLSATGGSVYKIPAGTATPSVILTGFNNPSGIVVNSLGDIFIGQYPTNSIIKVATGTTTKTIFVSAGLNVPYGMMFGPSGNLYVADEGSSTIKKITPAGVVTTVSNTGLSFPYDVAFDNSNNMYITDYGSNAILKSTASGFSISPALPAGLNFSNYSGTISGTPTATSPVTTYTITGINAQGTSTATVSIAVNTAAPVISYASPQVYTVAVAIPPLAPTNTGGAVGSYAAATTFKSVNSPYGVNIDASNNIFITDDVDGALYKYSSAGVGGTIYTLLNQPTGIADDGSGNIFVSNFGNNTVCKFSSSGTLLATITGFNAPYGITVDNSDNVYVVNNGTGSIIKIAAGTTTTSAFLTGFTNPYGITIDAHGNTFVSQITSNSIIEIAAGSTTHTTFATGFNGPRNIQNDDLGNIYVADFGNNVIKMITTGGIVSTVLSGFSSPRDVDFDASGNMFVADFGTNTIKKSIATGYAITSGTLPAGLYLNAYTGFITGTPTTIAAAANVTITATNGTGSSSCVISIAVGGAVAWTGGSSTTAWATGGNWNTLAAPGPNDAVTIGVSAYTHPFEPSITIANVAVNSLTFGAVHAGILTVGTGKTLTLGNNLTINTGASATLTGTGTGAVNIAPAAIVNINSTGVLTIISPLAFTLKSNATGSASIGQISSTSIAGTGADSINVERYITGGAGYRGYRLMSSPVYAAIVSSNTVYNVDYLNDHVFLTGTGGATNGFSKAGNPTLYLFREDQTPLNTSFTDGNFWGISNIAPNSHATYNYSVTGGNPGTTGSFNIPVGNGFMFFFRGDRTTVNPYVPGTAPVAATLIETGSLNIGQVIVHDWYTPASANLGWTNATANTAIRGFNLVGNPYASSIDWEQYNTTTTTSGIYANNIGNVIYELNPATNNYDIYQVGGIYTNHGTRIIASGQGFFVQATNNTAPQLIFNESAKTTAQNTGLNLFMATRADIASLNNANAEPHLRLQMTMDSINTDDIYIGFNAAASSKDDFSQDAPYKPGSGKVSLSSISSDNVVLAINKLPLPKLTPTIMRLKVNATSDGVYKLNMTEMTAIPQLFEIWLRDAYKNDSLDMRHNKTYAFNLYNADTNSFGSKRFSLVIRQNPALGIHLLNFTAAKVQGGAQVVWQTENEQNYTNFTVQRSMDNGATFDVLGGFASSAAGKYGFLDKNPPAAVDLYRLKIEDMNGTVSYSNIIKLTFGNNGSVANSNINIYPNPAKNVIHLIMLSPKAIAPSTAWVVTGNSTPSLVSGKTENTVYSIKIVNITGGVVKTAVSAQPDWQNDVTDLPPGTYIVRVLNNSDKSIVGEGTFVKL